MNFYGVSAAGDIWSALWTKFAQRKCVSKLVNEGYLKVSLTLKLTA